MLWWCIHFSFLNNFYTDSRGANCTVFIDGMMHSVVCYTLAVTPLVARALRPTMWRVAHLYPPSGRECEMNSRKWECMLFRLLLQRSLCTESLHLQLWGSFLSRNWAKEHGVYVCVLMCVCVCVCLSAGRYVFCIHEHLSYQADPRNRLIVSVQWNVHIWDWECFAILLEEWKTP